MSTHEVYCSLDICKLLKKAGFNWDTYSAYNKDGVFADKNRSITTWNDFADYYSAPTIEVAQRWLRVVKGIHLYIRPILDEHKYVVTVVVDDLTWGQVNDNNGTSKRFNTYEEAQEAGIKKALEMILEKGK